MKNKIKTCKVNIAPIGVLYCRTTLTCDRIHFEFEKYVSIN